MICSTLDDKEGDGPNHEVLKTLLNSLWCKIKHSSKVSVCDIFETGMDEASTISHAKPILSTLASIRSMIPTEIDSNANIPDYVKSVISKYRNKVDVSFELSAKQIVYLQILVRIFEWAVVNLHTTNKSLNYNFITSIISSLLQSGILNELNINGETTGSDLGGLNGEGELGEVSIDLEPIDVEDIIEEEEI
jgi:hypothetical protein